MKILAVLSLVLILAGCAGEGGIGAILQPQPTQPELTRAEKLEAEGNWLAAASAWRDQAATEESPAKESSLLRAVDMLLRAHALEEAQQLLNQVVIVNASPEQQVQLQILKSRLAIAIRRPSDALAELDVLRNIPLDTPAQISVLELRAGIYSQTGHHFEAARQYMQLDQLLDPLNQEENHNRIWEELNLLGTLSLAALRDSDTDKVSNGWLDLAWRVKDARQRGERLSLSIQQWQSRYPQHPAGLYIVHTVRRLDELPVSSPTHIALLLPLDGKFSGAARAIRDGFLDGYYADRTNGSNVTVRIYTVNNTDVTTVYEQAVANGATIVVGPLDKDALLSLLTREEFEVPVLALNDVPQVRLPFNVYSFALSPEDEARQVAEHIWLDGHSRGVALVPEGRWGERIYEAFRDRWLELGGELVEAGAFNSAGKNPDYASPVRGLLNIDESRARHKRMQNLLGRNIEYEMRRRQDINFIFMAANPGQARQIRPQFDFFNAGNLPVYATSHVYAGIPDQQADRDMNGITFGDMPWTIADNEQDRELKAVIQRYWGSQEQQAYIRLFAFGSDAWRLLPNLERLSQYRFARVNGSTGSLRIDKGNRVHRGLSWATFRSGMPRPVQPPVLSPATPIRIDAPLTPLPVPGG